LGAEREVARAVGDLALKVEVDGPEAGEEGGFLRALEEALDAVDGVVVLGVARQLGEARKLEAEGAGRG
jgi:hypothetical protein